MVKHKNLRPFYIRGDKGKKKFRDYKQKRMAALCHPSYMSIPKVLSGDEIRVDERVHGNDCEHEADDGNDYDADYLDPLEPGLAVPADGLEHTPESVGEVEPYGREPYEVEREAPPVAEVAVEEDIRVILVVADSEQLGKLHMGPELGEVEGDEAYDDKSEYEHVAGGPGVGRSLAGDLVALDAAAGDDVLEGKPASVEDMDREAERKDGNHDADYGSAHKVTPEFEESVAFGKELFIKSYNAIFTGE